MISNTFLDIIYSIYIVFFIAIVEIMAIIFLGENTLRNNHGIVFLFMIFGSFLAIKSWKKIISKFNNSID